MRSQRAIHYDMPSAWHGLGAARGIKKELGTRDVAQSAEQPVGSPGFHS